MMTKKFTDEEIIKGLTELSLYTGFQEKHIQVLNASLDLINRQKAEIERLKTENKIYIEANQVIGHQRDQRDKEIDELQKQIDGLDVRENKIKVEAYKEFAEKLKDAAMSCLMGGKYYKIITTRCIDTLLKEMAGEK